MLESARSIVLAAPIDVDATMVDRVADSASYHADIFMAIHACCRAEDFLDLQKVLLGALERFATIGVEVHIAVCLLAQLVEAAMEGVIPFIQDESYQGSEPEVPGSAHGNPVFFFESSVDDEEELHVEGDFI